MKKKNTGYRMEAGPNVSCNPDLVDGDAQSQRLSVRARAGLVFGLLAARFTGELDEEIGVALDSADDDPEGTNHYNIDMYTGAITRVQNNGVEFEEPPTGAAIPATGSAYTMQPDHLAAPKEIAAETPKPW